MKIMWFLAISTKSNKSKHADLVKLSPFRLRKKAANFTKPVFEALAVLNREGVQMK
ncbi:MAG: hypothetical protein ACI8V8_001951, partial [Chitinophagales bacterium]